MKKKILIAALLIFSLSSFGQVPGDEDSDMLNHGRLRDQKEVDEALRGWWTASMTSHAKRIAWWRDAKFGMFIHWGVYSLPAGEWKGKKVSGYAEHLMRKEKISRSEYLDLAKKFNPVLFNAEEWILHAQKAGMKYFIVTAKHHDGFALYDSKVSDFDIMDQTSFRRDPMAELAKAAKKHGMKFGFYYSHAFDWEHPDAPGNDWEYKNPGGDLNLYGGRDWFDLHPGLLPKAQKYVDEKAIPQILELLKRYEPDILWFYTPHKLPLSENTRILKAIRAADPDVVINGRLVRSASANFGDYKNTADRPAEFFPVTGDWEAIPTTNESYGFHRFDSSHKTVGHFIRLLANAASRGGNLLMNIGPKGDGAFDSRDLQILTGIGHWMAQNGESIHGSSPGPLGLQSWGVSTQKGNKLYLHVFNWPEDGKLYLGGLYSAPAAAYYLAGTGRKVEISRQSSGHILHLPLKAPDTSNTVIVLQFDGQIKADAANFVYHNVAETRLLAFDGSLHGKGFSFGDGKKDRYFVEGWSKMDQSISWTFQTLQPAKFRMVMKYLAEEGTGGTFRMQLNGKEKEFRVKTGNKIMVQETGELELPAGTHKLRLTPVDIKKELMKLLEVQLIPLKTKNSI